MFGTMPHWFGPGVPVLLLVLALAFYAAVILAIVKVFQIGRDVKEIKQKLLDGSVSPTLRPPA